MAKNVKIQISGSALIFLAALLLMLPLKWVGALFLAAVIHEFCHFVAVYILGGTVEYISIGSRGVVMKSEPMSVAREILAASAGPVGSICLLLFVRWIPRTAICGAIHGLYNIIPLLPLDGGRVLRGILFALLTPPKAESTLKWTQRSVLTLLCIGCVLLASKTGVFVLLFMIFLLRSYHRENPLAKRPVWRYNRGTIEKEVSYDRIAQEDSSHCSEAGPVYRWGV